MHSMMRPTQVEENLGHLDLREETLLVDGWHRIGRQMAQVRAAVKRRVRQLAQGGAEVGTGYGGGYENSAALSTG